MAYLPELEKYADRVTVVPQDEAGLLDLDAILGAPDPRALVYCCGPEPARRGRGTLQRLAARRRCTWSGSRPSRSTRATATTSFEIVLQRSGLTFTVPPDATVFQ